MRITGIIAVLALATIAFTADRPALKGNWMLDTKQSTGDVPEWSSMSVAQKGSWVRMAQNDKNGREIRSFEGECKTDGRFHPVDGGNGGSISCKWEGATLVVREHWNNAQDEREVRTGLTPDGKLVQEIQAKGSAPSQAKLVWMKQ